MKNLYDILGVDQTASEQEIKKAYRAKAKEHHPDAGGEEAKFKEVQHAYDILSDSEKRARYDRGEPMDNQEDLRDKQARSFLYQLFEQCIDKYGSTRCPFKSMKESINANIRNLDEEKKKVNKRKETFEKAKKRVQKGESFVSLCDQIIKTCENLCTALDSEKELGNYMLELLKDPTFEVEKPEELGQISAEDLLT